MPTRVITTARYIGAAKTIFLEALDPNELAEAMSGLARYDGLPETGYVEGETYLIDVTMWEILKTKEYQMFIARLNKDACVLESREKGGVIQQWDHRLSVTQDGDQAIWVDDVVMDAGAMTFFMARFGAYMYRRRHKYRKALGIETEIMRVD